MPETDEKSEAGRTLSELGASKGGKARAKSLTGEQRSEIARRAAEKRWEGQTAQLPKETHTGILKIGNKEIPCSVLDNGLRVFSTRGFTRAMGGKQTGTKGTETGAPKLPPFLASETIKPFISQELMARLSIPIPYKPEHRGRSAYGYEATLLPEICEAILDANKDGKLKKNQARLAETAEILLRGFARVGVIALVDEATGYQADRARDELVKILEAYISKELLPWTRRFPPEFFEEIYRINGWRFIPGNLRGPRYVGKLINQLVYKRLPPGVLEELQRKNPVQENAHRRHKHHQFLTEDVGDEHLEKQIIAVTTLMRASDDKKMFKRLFEKAFPIKGQQLALPMPEEEGE